MNDTPGGPRKRVVPRSGYRAYIRSPEWAEVKARYRASNLPQHCVGCRDKSKPVEFHHRSYARLGCEYLTDLVPLCRDCHEETHLIARRIAAGNNHPGAYESALYIAAKHLPAYQRHKKTKKKSKRPEPIRGSKKHLRRILNPEVLAYPFCAGCGAVPKFTLAPRGKPCWPLCTACAYQATGQQTTPALKALLREKGTK